MFKVLVETETDDGLRLDEEHGPFTEAEAAEEARILRYLYEYEDDSFVTIVEEAA